MSDLIPHFGNTLIWPQFNSIKCVGTVSWKILKNNWFQFSVCNFAIPCFIDPFLHFLKLSCHQIAHDKISRHEAYMRNLPVSFMTMSTFFSEQRPKTAEQLFIWPREKSVFNFWNEIWKQFELFPRNKFNLEEKFKQKQKTILVSECIKPFPWAHVLRVINQVKGFTLM